MRRHAVINQAHFLETWGDGRAYDGTVTICQPLIAPLFNGRTAIEVLSILLGENAEITPREIVKAYWRKNWPAWTGNQTRLTSRLTSLRRPVHWRSTLGPIR